MTFAFEKFKEINTLKEINDKHRAWLKLHEGLRYGHGVDRHYTKGEKWTESSYKDLKYDVGINLVGRLPNQTRIEFDGNPKEAKENLEKVVIKLKELGIGFIRTTHNGKCDYLWVEFTRDIKDSEAKKFLMWIAPENSEVDLNFCSSKKIFPCMFAVHWKHSYYRELPIEFFEGKQIDFKDLKISENLAIKRIIKNEGEFEYETGIKSGDSGFKIEILELIALSSYDPEKKRVATEKISRKIMENNFIYTTRSDERSEIWIYKDGIYAPNGKSYIKEKCREILGHLYTTQLVNEIVSKIEVDTYIESEEFFKENHIEEIPVENGLLNIFTGTLSPFNPDKIFFSKIPIKFDPTLQCPNIEKFFLSILKNPDDLKVIEELFGYCLLKDYRIEKAFMFIGSGRNGKSKTLELLKRFIGPENCANISIQELEKDTFALSNLYSKLVNISGDLSSEALNNTGNFKMLTGMDLISANRKFLPRVHFVNHAKQVYSANKLPISYDTTPAFFNRWVILEFPYTFLSQKEIDSICSEEEKAKCRLADKEIISRITTPEELSGLLNRALLGLNRLITQRDFSYSQSIADVKNLWIRKSDSFQAFCMDHVQQDYKNQITKAELRKAYSSYCIKFKLPSAGDKAIKETLTREFGVVEDRKMIYGNQEYVWIGIKTKGIEEDGK